MDKKILIAVIILVLGISAIIYVNYQSNYKITSIVGKDFTLLSPSWDTQFGKGIDCTNAKATNEESQPITFDLTIKEAEVSNFICELKIDGSEIYVNSKMPYQSIKTEKLFNVYQSHLISFCCNKEGFPQQCDKQPLSKFCD
jgi:hypothetical protein